MRTSLTKGLHIFTIIMKYTCVKQPYRLAAQIVFASAQTANCFCPTSRGVSMLPTVPFCLLAPLHRVCLRSLSPPRGCAGPQRRCRSRTPPRLCQSRVRLFAVAHRGRNRRTRSGARVAAFGACAHPAAPLLRACAPKNSNPILARAFLPVPPPPRARRPLACTPHPPRATNVAWAAGRTGGARRQWRGTSFSLGHYPTSAKTTREDPVGRLWWSGGISARPGLMIAAAHLLTSIHLASSPSRIGAAHSGRRPPLLPFPSSAPSSRSPSLSRNTPPTPGQAQRRPVRRQAEPCQPVRR